MLPSLKRTTINLVVTWSVKVLSAFVPLLTVPIVVAHFGLEGLGLWLVVLQFSRHIQLLNIGLNTSLVRFLAKFDALENKRAKSAYLSTGLTTLVGIAILIIAISFPLSDLVAEQLQLNNLEKEEVPFLLKTAIFAVALSLPLGVGYSMLASLHAFDKIAIYNLLAQVLWLIGLIILVSSDSSKLALLGIVYFGAFLVKDFILFTSGYFAMGRPKINLVGWSRDVFKDIMSVSIAAFLMSMSALLLRQGSPLLAGFAFDIEVVPLVGLPLMVLFGISPFLMIFSRLITPVASAAYALGEERKLSDILIFSCQYAFHLSSLICFIFLLLGMELFSVWLGDVVEKGKILQVHTFFLILMISFSFAVPGQLVRSTLVAIGKHWSATKQEIFINSMGFMCCIIAVFIVKSGPLGIILGISIAFLLRGFGGHILTASTCLDFRYFEFLKRVFLVPIIFAILALFIIFLTPNISDMTLGQRALILIAIIGIWLFVGYKFVLNIEHRVLLATKTKAWLKR